MGEVWVEASLLLRQRCKDTSDQMASTIPNGHAPCRKPYTDPSAQAPANARTNHALKSSSE
jgi:hypothetical protein